MVGRDRDGRIEHDLGAKSGTRKSDVSTSAPSTAVSLATEIGRIGETFLGRKRRVLEMRERGVRDRRSLALAMQPRFHQHVARVQELDESIRQHDRAVRC